MAQSQEDDSETPFNWTLTVELSIDASKFVKYLISRVSGGQSTATSPGSNIFGVAIATSTALNVAIPGAMSVGPIVFENSKLIQDSDAQDLEEEAQETSSYKHCSSLVLFTFYLSSALFMTGMPLLNWLKDCILFQTPIFGAIWYILWHWLTSKRPRTYPHEENNKLTHIHRLLDTAALSEFWATSCTAFTVSQSCAVPLSVLPFLVQTFVNLRDHLLKNNSMTAFLNYRGLTLLMIFFGLLFHSNNENLATIELTLGVPDSDVVIYGLSMNRLNIIPDYWSLHGTLLSNIENVAESIMPKDYIWSVEKAVFASHAFGPWTEPIVQKLSEDSIEHEAVFKNQIWPALLQETEQALNSLYTIPWPPEFLWIEGEVAKDLNIPFMYALETSKNHFLSHQ